MKAIFRFIAAGLACAASASMAAADRPPNIVVIFIDDMGWGDLSCFGNRDAATPQIDRLAAEGIRFEQFYVASPICSPSRVALLTGQYPTRWDITSFLNNRADNERRGIAQWLDPTAPSLARRLKTSGYATGHFGKWHMGGQRNVDDAPAIHDYGFDESLTNFEGMGPKLLPLTLKPGDAHPGRIWAKAESLGGPVVWMRRSEITGGFVGAATAFMRRAVASGRPFYVNVWPDDVHSPFWPSVDRWGDGSQAALYRAVLEEMDLQLGTLFDFIRDTPEIRDNTLIVLCSDNGPDPGAGSAGPLRGTKTMLYEGGIRSPLIVWGPEIIDPNKVGTVNRTSVLSTMDLNATLSTIGHAEPAGSPALDGESLPEVLLGKSEASRIAPLFFRRPPDRDSFGGVPDLPDLAVRSGPWKLLCEYDGSAPELYDLEVDPSETTNVAATYPEIVARLSRELISWHRSMPADNGPSLGSPTTPSVP